MVSRLPNYGIKAGYRSRSEYRRWNDQGFRDRYQRPVYELVRDLMLREGLRTVLDIGCGSGYKLANILEAFDTTGLELPENLALCQKAYPDRRWGLSVLTAPCPLPVVDVVLSADVIEHLPDPDVLMDYLAAIEWKWLILSTPDRDRARGVASMGPPPNGYHIREWNSEEFQNYVAQWFDVVSAVGMRQHTHTLVCVPRER